MQHSNILANCFLTVHRCEIVDFADSEVVTFLKQLVEQLAVLREYLEKQFEPTYGYSLVACDSVTVKFLPGFEYRKNEIAGLATYDHITFDLLKYHYRVGETLTTTGPGRKVCTSSKRGSFEI